VTEKRADVMDSAEATASSQWRQYPQWLRDRLEWFQDLKFGLFMHWGPYSQWGCIESWPLVPDDTWARPDDLPAWVERGKDIDRFQADYRALNKTFNPTRLDPVPWAEAAQRAGMKYVAFTTKHHDGFCMFDTRTTDYRITHPDCPFSSDPRANIARGIFDCFREHDFGITCYFSKSDWHCPFYWSPDAPARMRNPNYDTHEKPELWAKFVEFVHAQIRELMSDYGRMDVLWLDGGQVRPPNQDIRMDDMVAMARSLQPGLIVADRTVGGPHENILTPEQRIPDKPLDHPWESCLTMGKGWAYRPDDEYKPTRELIHMLVDIVAKGGNLLLNIGPTPEGEFDPTPMKRLQELGEWMSVNAEAIHGTRPIAPYKEANVCYTCKADTVSAVVLAEEGQEAPPASVLLKGQRPPEEAEIRMLGLDRPLVWESLGDAIRVHMPDGPLPCEHAWTLQFPKC